MKHIYSKSMDTIPSSTIKVSQISTQTGRESVLKLPNLKNKSYVNLSNRSNTQTIKKKKKVLQTSQPEVIDPHEMEIIQKVREKAKLLGLLKQKIIQCGDNLFVKKVLSEIKFTSLGKVGLEIWQKVEQFQKCDKDLLERIYDKYQLKITDQSLRTMDFINNVCRFTLADYKRKRWRQKQRDVNDQVDKNKNTIKQVSKKLQEIETPDTKLQILLTLAGMKQECYAKKQCYVNWKERAIEKLKSNQVKCKILRAEIFTQGFY